MKFLYPDTAIELQVSNFKRQPSNSKLSDFIIFDTDLYLSHLVLSFSKDICLINCLFIVRFYYKTQSFKLFQCCYPLCAMWVFRTFDCSIFLICSKTIQPLTNHSKLNYFNADLKKQWTYNTKYIKNTYHKSFHQNQA